MEENNDKYKIQKSKCTHVRLRGGSDFYPNVEALIKSIEKELHIDFRSLSQWQDLVKRLHLVETTCKRKIQNANLQKAAIIEKLYTQTFRLSPFELTEILSRTADRWDKLKPRRKSDQSEVLSSSDQEVVERVEEEVDAETGETLHNNTIDLSVETKPDERLGVSKVNIGAQLSSVITDMPPSNLPVFITTNIHPLISPIDSKITQLSYHSVHDHVERAGEENLKELLSTSIVICNPTKIIIVKNTLKQQSILFSLTNCTTEYLHVRFEFITNNYPFKNFKLYPVIPKRLYPGIAVLYKFVFKLRNEEEFKSGLHFKIGRDVYAHAPAEPFLIPIVTSFTIQPLVTISETVTIPAAYPWHIKMTPKSEYPTGIFKISSDGPISYHLHIRKREIDLLKKQVTSIDSLYSESFQDRESLVQSSLMNQSHSIKNVPVSKNMLVNDLNKSTIEVKIEDVMSDILYEIVCLALDSFLFGRTYLYVQPNSTKTIPVYFTEAEYTGYHHSYYDVEIINPETENIDMTKTFSVLAEALPNPIQIAPLILDMSKSPHSHGIYEDHFIISNTHKVYQAIIYINLTTKMKKLFHVEPMKITIQPQASVQFDVKFCSKEHLQLAPSEYLVHFTFKISIVGFKPVYKNIPPIFYEIIAPCEYEFEKVYPPKYYKTCTLKDV